MNFIEKHFKVYWLQILLVFLSSGFVGFVYLHFFKQQASILHLMFAECLYCLVNVLVIIFRGRVRYRYDIMASFVLMISSFVLVFFPFSIPLLYLFIILFGVGSITFYNAYNILFFRTVKSENRMWGMTVYFTLGGAAGVVGPLIGSVVFSHFGLNTFLIIAIVIAIVSFLLARHLPAGECRYTVRQLLDGLKGIRTINLIDGALHRINLVAFSLFSLFFIHDVGSFGLFISAMSLVAMGVSLINAKRSDRLKKRFNFIVWLSIFASALILVFYNINTLFWFVVFALALKTIIVMLEPFRSNIVQDSREFAPSNWVARELILNMGRTLVLTATTALVYFGMFRWSFVLFAVLFLLFPFLVWYKKIYR